MLRDDFEEVLVDGSMYMEGFIALLAEILKSVAAEKDAWVSVQGSFSWAEWMIHFWFFQAFGFFFFFFGGGSRVFLRLRTPRGGRATLGNDSKKKMMFFICFI